MPHSDKRATRLFFWVAMVLAVSLVIWFFWPALAALRQRLAGVSGHRVTELVHVTAWPALVAAGLIAVRSQLGALASALAGRASKVSIMNVEIELAQASQLHAWPTPTIQAIREADSALMASDSSASLFQELHGTAADFAVVNLGQGREWLTSRVYVLATLLRRMRSLRAIVFLTDSSAYSRLFVGTVLPDRLRTRLDTHYPWLGQCLQEQYSATLGRRAGELADRLDPYEAQRILAFYIEDLRKRPADAADNEWTETRPAVSEHAVWLDGGRLAKVLGADLDPSAVEWKPTLGKEDARDILGKNGSFVALVDRNGVFRDALIDRAAMVGSVVREVAAHL